MWIGLHFGRFFSQTHLVTLDNLQHKAIALTLQLSLKVILPRA
jgi:hypothetical protein